MRIYQSVGAITIALYKKLENFQSINVFSWKSLFLLKITWGYCIEFETIQIIKITNNSRSLWNSDWFRHFWRIIEKVSKRNGIFGVRSRVFFFKYASIFNHWMWLRYLEKIEPCIFLDSSGRYHNFNINTLVWANQILTWIFRCFSNHEYFNKSNHALWN